VSDPRSCAYCGSELSVYTSRSGSFLKCPVCYRFPGIVDAPGTESVRSVKRARSRAHEAFDPLWKKAPLLYGTVNSQAEYDRLLKIARGRAYAWLAETLGKTPEECHMRFMDVADCDRVVEACEGMTAKKVREWSKARLYERFPDRIDAALVAVGGHNPYCTCPICEALNDAIGEATLNYEAADIGHFGWAGA